MTDHIINEKDQTRLVIVPEGEFVMGSDLFDERPSHAHRLSSFYISLCPVTNSQYERFVLETGYNESDEWREYASSDRAEHPVVKVSWYDATAYCKWAGLRLPNEAEWEKACRGTDGREYPWGDEWEPERCRNSVESEDETGTSDVKAFENGRSPYGLYQMAGNIWEWCENTYADDLYTQFADGDFTFQDKGDAGVLRGGGWEDVDEFFYRCSTRLSNPRSLRHRQAGFRPVR